jgi:hypothetical protein
MISYILIHMKKTITCIFRVYHIKISSRIIHILIHTVLYILYMIYIQTDCILHQNYNDDTALIIDVLR